MAEAVEERAVAFEWRDDQDDRGDGAQPITTLRGVLAVPRADAADAANAPTAAVILAHGYLSTRDGISLFPRLARALAALGVASLRFDFRGAGQTGGEARLGDYGSQARQIAAARRFLEEEQGGGGGGNSKKKYRVVGVLGHSKGATSALLYAADGWAAETTTTGRQAPPPPPPPPPLRLVHLSGRFDLRRGLERFFGAGNIDRLMAGEVDFLPVRSREMVEGGKLSAHTINFDLTAEGARERVSVDVAAAAARLGASGRAEVLVVHGSNDDAVPVEDGRAVWRAVFEAEEEEGAARAAAAEAGAGAGGEGKEARKRPARARLVEIKGADHNFLREEYVVAALEAIVPFFTAAAAAEEEDG